MLRSMFWNEGNLLAARCKDEHTQYIYYGNMIFDKYYRARTDLGWEWLY